MNNRLTADARLKQLRLAILRIERGRSHQGIDKLSIRSVAREAGVTPALIHNRYPQIAEMIREKLNRSSRKQRDQKQYDLNLIQGRNRELRAEVNALKQKLAKIASANASLMTELASLRALAMPADVVPLRRP